jgi:simple sugar transport system permease protein
VIALDLLAAAALFAAPLLVAAIGELAAERAGIVNIGIEGMVLAGALGAAMGNTYHGFAAGLASAVLAASILAAVFAVVSLGFAADQIVTGAGINLLALGVTQLIDKRSGGALAGQGIHQVSPWWMVCSAPVLVGAAAWYFARTRWGLEHTAVGESPEAADAAGVAVNRRKLFALLFAAACAGLAGAYATTMRTAGFVEIPTAGQGFLALALVIFGRWNAWGIMLAALFFGLVRAGANYLGVYVPGQSVSKVLDMLPYVVSLLALAGLAGRSRSPAALGRAYVRG